MCASTPPSGPQIHTQSEPRTWFETAPIDTDTHLPAEKPAASRDFPALGSHWETVGGLVLTVTDHQSQDHYWQIHLRLTTQERTTWVSLIHFHQGLEHGLLTPLERPELAGTALATEATNRQHHLQDVCKALNDGDGITRALLEDHEHSIILSFEIPPGEDPETVPTALHDSMVTAGFTPLFDTHPQDSFAGSFDHVRNGWAQHRYLYTDTQNHSHSHS